MIFTRYITGLLTRAKCGLASGPTIGSGLATPTGRAAAVTEGSVLYTELASWKNNSPVGIEHVLRKGREGELIPGR